jgi:IMP dehydrogenase
MVNMTGHLPTALSYDDVLLVPQYSTLKSRSQVDLSTQLTPHLRLQIPLISSNMDTVTGINMAITLGKLGGISILPRFNQIPEQADMVRQVKKEGVLVGAAVGVKPGYLDRAKALIEAGVDLLVVDVAHGHLEIVLQACRSLKQAFPHTDLVAGNVATYEAAKDLFAAGVDCVKVGIGPGHACTTRIVTGFGVPQITALMDAALAARQSGKTLICDGGIKNPGDIVKGLAAGAHAVMIGSQFAGTDEAPGEVIEREGKKFKQYNGSTSVVEKQKQIKKIGSEVDTTYIKNVEGASTLVHYTGPLSEQVEKMCAGIHSGFSYAGAANISEFHEKAKFVRVTPLAWNESAYRFIETS